MSNLQRFYNNAQADLVNPIGAVDTVFLVGNGEVANFPSVLTGGQFFYATISDNNLQLNIRETQWEIVRVTAITDTGPNKTVTCVRGQEGTTASGWLAGNLFSGRVTAGSMDAAFARPSFDDILTDGDHVLLDGSGNVLYTC